MSDRRPIVVLTLLAPTLLALLIASSVQAQDINGNGVADSIDIKIGTSEDCNSNGVPDEVDLDRPSFGVAVGHSNDTATLTNAHSSVAIDIDADGDLDLVVAARSGQNNSTLTIWRNDGGPALAFDSRQTVANALCFALQAGDLNGDGALDIVASDSGFTNVVVAIANGAGGFLPPTKLPAGSRGTGIALADLDADGDLDIASAGFMNNSVDIFKGNGNGTFAPKVAYACGQQPSDVAAGDVTGDGLPDLVVANSFLSAPGSGTVTVLRNIGNAVFVTHGTVTIPGSSKPSDVALADVDGDVDLDLLVSSKGVNTLVVHANDGAGAFTAIQTLGPLPAISSAADRFLCADLDGDAAPEIAWCDSLARVVRLYDNLRGSFTALRAFAAGQEGPIHVLAADLTNDGVADLVTSNDSSSTISVLRGLGGLVYDAVEHLRRADSNAYPLLADMTGDGVVDLASYGTSDSPATFRIAAGNGDGTFASAAIIPLPSAAPLFLRDVNADGSLDILGLGNSGARYCKLNNGDGTFSAPIFSNPVAFQGNFQTTDINADGHLDMLWTWTPISSEPYHVRISFGDGTGFFEPYVEFLTPPFLGDVWTGDLDGDGAPEIFAAVAPGVVAPVGEETFLVYPNNGDGTFGGSAIVSFDMMPSYNGGVGNFAWVDIDGDGDNDLLAAAGNTFLYRNEGGSLAAPVNVGGLANYGRTEFGPRIADADADGDLDFFGTSAINGTSSPAIFFNDGSGAFGPRSTLVRYRANADSIVIGDVDGDAHPDLLVKPQGFTDWYLHREQPSDVADCDGNGVADACDIESGVVEDLNANGVPDECEVIAVFCDLNGDGVVGGADLAIVLAAWGTAGGLADLNADGIVDAADIALVLGAWDE